MAVIKVNLKVNGKEGLKRILQRMEEAVKPPKLTESVSKGADVYVRGAQDRAPVDTGALKGSIRKERSDKGEAAFKISPHVFYAPFQEFGAHGHPFMTYQYKGRWVRKRELKPHPYIRPTWEEDTPRAAEAVIEDILKNIRG